eukprot:TRINITY_DN10247_c0_g2_i2.p1 TRINITY_DN10247_c0_g2~~TRINITY_DN10247_c0_g2_i2.p1  ORF type:complete len:180 (-),score=43.27 TRINITY_DN10247_c0_g2_i2:288-827(-)
MGKEEREALIRNEMIKRDSYELQNCGGFVRIYPDEAKNSKYQTFLEYVNAEMDQFYGIRRRSSFSRSKPYADLQLISNPYSMAKDKFPENKYLERGSSTTNKPSHHFASDKLSKIASIYGSKFFQDKSSKNAKILTNAKRSMAEYRVLMGERKVVVLRPQTTAIQPVRPAFSKNSNNEA